MNGCLTKFCKQLFVLSSYNLTCVAFIHLFDVVVDVIACILCFCLCIWSSKVPLLRPHDFRPKHFASLFLISLLRPVMRLAINTNHARY